MAIPPADIFHFATSRLPVSTLQGTSVSKHFAFSGEKNRWHHSVKKKTLKAAGKEKCLKILIAIKEKTIKC